MINPFKKKNAEIMGKAKERKDRQEERRHRAQTRGQQPIK